MLTDGIIVRVLAMVAPVIASLLSEDDAQPAEQQAGGVNLTLFRFELTLPEGGPEKGS